MTSPLDELIKISQDLETSLEDDYGATGRGLHEKASSVENELTPEIMKKIRFIATIRNKAVHDDVNVASDEIDNVRSAAEDIYRELQGRSHKRRSRRRYSSSSSSSGGGSIMKIIDIVIKILNLFLRRRR